VKVRPWLVTSLLLLAPAARGEDAQTRRAEEIVVEDESVRPLEPFEAAPTETEVLPKQEIERRPATHASEVVSRLPGIRTQQRVQGEEAAVSIEGLPPEFTRALVDGRRYTGEIGGVDDLQDLPLADVERIEIVRGAQGLRFGSEAAGGVIRLETADPPTQGWRADLDGGGGSDGRILGAGRVALGTEQIGGSLRFVHDQIDGYDAPDDAEAVVLGTGSDSRSLSRDVYASLVARPFESLELASHLGFRREDDTLTAFEDLPDGRNESQRWLAAQELTWTLDEATSLEAGFGWYRTSLDSEAAREFTLDENEWAVDGAAERVFTWGPVLQSVLLGFDLRHQGLDLEEGALARGIEIPDYVPGSADERFGLAGFFLIGETQLTEWLALETGFRAQLHSKFSPAWIPQLALLTTPWDPGDGRLLRFRVSWGQSYRSPSLRDLYQPTTPQLGGAYFLAGNTELDPETLSSWRVGMELVPTAWLGLSVTGFHNDIQDHIRSTFDGEYVQTGTDVIVVPPPPLDPDLELICAATGYVYPECNPEGGILEQPRFAPLFEKMNLDDVTTRGIEVRLRWQPHRRIRFEAAYTLLDTRVRDSNVDIDELPNEPPHMVDTLIALTLPRLETQLTVQTRWRDAAPTETSGTGGLGFASPDRSDPSVQVDLRLAQPLTRRISVYGDLYNVTDTRVVDSYVVRGRSFFVGLRGSFD
jgi:outer membrane receptor for ferrienterochelin and colicin